MNYIYTDNQGSVIALTDEVGTVKRGYTGHEHLDAFGDINMNGRIYDPMTAQFFSPDPMLTDAGNWLDYNRYGYCLNNPFRYTDPSGYTWWAENGNMVITTTASIVVGGVVAIATAGVGVPAMITSGMASGAAGGFTSGAVGTALAGGSFSEAMNAGLHGAAIGAVMGNITAGIGTSFGGLGGAAKTIGGKILNELGRAGVHAFAQGGFSAIIGGDFWQGAAAGFVSSLAGSTAQGIGIHGWGMVGVSAASGGIGAAIVSGKAEDILFGVVQGAMVGALNHLGNEMQLKKLYNEYLTYNEKILQYSIVGTALIESTEAGELITNIREAIADVYGLEKDKAYKSYKESIDILKNIKKLIGSNKEIEYGITFSSLSCYAEAMKYNVKSNITAFQIKLLDEDFYNQHIIKTYNYGSGGAGTTGNW